MSAIWGSISFQGNLPDTVQESLSKPFHTKYQVDRIENQVFENACMGCGIQYVTPEASHEKLPILDEKNGILFTADCMLDNRQELIAALCPEEPSVPDGTLMYLGFLKWGIQCTEHFLGLYSMAVYDFEKKTLYLAADRTSSRCLYYYRSSTGVTFSTVMGSIRNLHPQLSRNELFIEDYLFAPFLQPNVVPDETPWEGVYKMMPGQWIAFTPEDTQKQDYWEPSMGPVQQDLKFKGPEEVQHAFMELYRRCVSDAIRTDTNVGIAMSSGLDSASVAALAAEKLAKDQKKLYAYTYVPFENPGRQPRNFVCDETKDVLSIVEMHPNILPHFVNAHGSNSISFIGEEISWLEIPFKAFQNMPNLFEIYSNAAKDGCRVVLNGQCGNSSVSYGELDRVLYEEYLHHHYFEILRSINNYGKHIRISRKMILNSAFQDFRREKKKHSEETYHMNECNVFVNPELQTHYPLQIRFEKGHMEHSNSAASPRTTSRNALNAKSMYTYLGEIETKMGLYAGCIIRDPTRDPRILNFCYHLPNCYFGWHGTPRWLIRGNFRELLPVSLLDNWNRYGLQNADWMQRLERDWGTVAPILQKQLSESYILPYINQSKLKEFFENTCQGTSLPDDFTVQYLIFIYILSLYLAETQE